MNDGDRKMWLGFGVANPSGGQRECVGDTDIIRVRDVPRETDWRTTSGAAIVPRLRSLALRGLVRMYLPDERLFAFRVRQVKKTIISEGLSRRYTAIALIGLAEQGEAVSSSVLTHHDLHNVCERLMADVPSIDNLGDVALIAWAAHAVGYPTRSRAWERLLQLRPAERAHPVVGVAWALAALCVDPEARVGELRERLALRLVSSCGTRSGIFPHTVGGKGPDLRSHVSCFADLVYPIHALAHYSKLSGGGQALDVASRCAEQICRRQGAAGQWWWHYDRRTGDVIEPYPVYAVHQDAMAPMALFALQDAGGADFTPEIEKGLAWLARAPELRGGSLIDNDTDLIWRKVARREPGKLSCYLQAIVSRLHPTLRVPGLDAAFPVGKVDYEDRPYHLGWLLYTWSPARVATWIAPGVT